MGSSEGHGFPRLFGWRSEEDWPGRRGVRRSQAWRDTGTANTLGWQAVDRWLTKSRLLSVSLYNMTVTVKDSPISTEGLFIGILGLFALHKTFLLKACQLQYYFPRDQMIDNCLGQYSQNSRILKVSTGSPPMASWPHGPHGPHGESRKFSVNKIPRRSGGRLGGFSGVWRLSILGFWHQVCWT